MFNLLLPRMAIALVWGYQGLWCKLLGRAPHHEQILETTPLLSSLQAHRALLALGTVECLLAVWVLSGLRPQSAAVAETILLVSMNVGGLRWARRLIQIPLKCSFKTLSFCCSPGWRPE